LLMFLLTGTGTIVVTGAPLGGESTTSEWVISCQDAQILLCSLRNRPPCSSDAQRAPRRYSGSPEPRDDRKDRDRDPRAGSRAAYDDVPPPADARY
jgi:hypothetical protein